MQNQQHLKLAEFLAAPTRPVGTLSYHELQGFLFAIACAPEPVPPSDWIPLVFNDQSAGYAGMNEARLVMESLVELYNAISTQVDEDRVILPENITLPGNALENVGGDAPLAQWSRGFDMGHDWLHDIWSHYTPPVLEGDLDYCLMVLSYFSSRRLAEDCFAEIPAQEDLTLAEHAGMMLDEFEVAMHDYARLGRALGRLVTNYEDSRQPADPGHGVDHDGPCPCGSGKKYRKCCLQ